MQNNGNGIKRIIIIDLNYGDFVVDEEENWHFKSKTGHMWKVDKFPDKLKDGEEVTEEGLITISSDNGFCDNPVDKIWPIYPKIMLEKKRVSEK